MKSFSNLIRNDKYSNIIIQSTTTMLYLFDYHLYFTIHNNDRKRLIQSSTKSNKSI